jgi:acetylornithine deacetylase/succinyl-diaminopimelate desuccinylase-like protein
MGEHELRDEVVELARALIRIDTSNPPGDETPAAELLAEYLRGAGLEPELIGPDSRRLNMVARIEGGEGPSLMLMAHTDVVPAPPDDWSVPPFEGHLRDRQIVGRGAVDMKNELAARAVAFAAFARSGAVPAGDLVLVAESDEERNTADVGMSWLVCERPELRCDYALNEGGGLLLELAGGQRVVTVAVGEKQVTSLRLRVHGRAGHGSVPTRTDNAVAHAASAVDLLLDHRSPARLPASVGRALRALGAPEGDDEALSWACDQHPVLAELLPAMTRLTVTPTGLQTFEPPNVIPPFADVICDCRPLPGQTEADIRAHVDEVLGKRFGYDLALLEPLEGGTESRLDTPLYRVLSEYIATRLPGARLLPLISTGFTDSHWIRRAHGTVAYGFAPVFSTKPAAYLEAAHAADEALDLADLVEMAEFHLHALTALGSMGAQARDPA